MLFSSLSSYPADAVPIDEERIDTYQYLSSYLIMCAIDCLCFVLRCSSLLGTDCCYVFVCCGSVVCVFSLFSLLLKDSNLDIHGTKTEA